MSTTRRPQPPRLSPGERRARVLDAALDVFASRGYSAGMGDVARAAGVTRTVLYHYFPSKDELFVAVLEAQAALLFSSLLPVYEMDASQAVRARATADALVAFIADERPSWELLFHHRDDDEPAVAAARLRIHDRLLAATASTLAADLSAAGIDAGSARAALFAEMSLGALVALGRWWRDHPEVSRAEAADAVHDLLWRGTSTLRP